MDLVELTKAVQDAIDKGATSVEQVHRQIANMPLDFLSKIEQLEGPVSQAREFQDKTIGSIYEAIHNINAKASEIATDLLSKINSGNTTT
ncbi:MAG TPA: hypothetical protein PK079_07300 [Leptospiraceae bacterium]|nr:hypothetical protein [Leptospiraceae bacterium]HMW05771.1 hypothetical protein [Leptospiraceae bacterium]HMX33845.1 hypothetical protein [Leptospiraceae bacterium]HMY33354.1 hypothetical protein [Leptospiraceae bacterium]HMZ65427.1 hypothetical protein [Leptospiraceae bacterium]